jgi:hypothetical protein
MGLSAVCRHADRESADRQAAIFPDHVAQLNGPKFVSKMPEQDFGRVRRRGFEKEITWI